MSKVLIILAAGILLFLLFRWLKAEYAKQGRPFAIKAALSITAIILIALAATGRVHWLGAIAASLLAALRFALPMLFKALPFLQFLHRRQNTDSQNTQSKPPAGMSKEDAAKILGVSPSASKEEIITAHRQLIQKLHPDRGGNEYLATQLNAAKEILLKDR